MQIAQIWMAQRSLRRVEQIPAMIEALKTGGDLPRIILLRSEDGEIQVQDGHHRLVAYWLAGRESLGRYEYILLEGDQYRPRRGKIERLLEEYETATGTLVDEPTEKAVA